MCNSCQDFGGWGGRGQESWNITLKILPNCIDKCCKFNSTSFIVIRVNKTGLQPVQETVEQASLGFRMAEEKSVQNLTDMHKNNRTGGTSHPWTLWTNRQWCPITTWKFNDCFPSKTSFAKNLQMFLNGRSGGGGWPKGCVPKIKLTKKNLNKLTGQDVLVSVLFSINIFFSFLARVLGLLLQGITEGFQWLKQKKYLLMQLAFEY